MEEKYKRKEIRNFYKDVRHIKKGYTNRVTHYKNKEGELIGEEEGIIKRWKEYFEELLNEEMGEDTQQQNTNNREKETSNEVVEDVTREEINNIVQVLKNNKSPGQNLISAENIKYGGEIIKEKIYELIKDIWTRETLPKAWSTSIIIPLFKKGDKTNCENYRGIALLDVVYKIFASIIKKRIEPYIESELGEYQGGFRKNRATTDQVFTLKQILISCYEYSLPVHMLFIDFKKAYDSVKRTEVIDILKEYKVPAKLVRLIQTTLDKTMCAVRIDGKTSEHFQVKSGLRQGDPLSTILFNAVLEKVIRESGINREGTIYTKSHQCLAYADDIVLIARSAKELQRITQKLTDAAGKRGLQINEEKSNYLQLKTNAKNTAKIETYGSLEITTNDGDNLKFRGVESYMYLGVPINNRCNEEEEIKFRIAKGNRCAGGLHSMITSKQISRNTKVRIYKTILRPTLMYASETWVLNKSTQSELEIWERTILRRIYGGKKGEMGYERRTNKEIYDLFKEPPIGEVVKARRMQWLGHLERMNEQRIVKHLAWKEPVGKKRKGRPRKKWREAVAIDLKERQITNWKEKAKDRKTWQKIIKLWA